MSPSFPRYKEGTGGRGQIEPGPPVILLHNSTSLNSSIVIACATSSNANYSGSTHMRVQIDGLKLV